MGAQSAWARFRDLANVLFVIAFLIVVFSQITSVGITNYGIKRCYPALSSQLLALNLSFLICQIPGRP